MIFVTVGTNEARFDRLLEAAVQLQSHEHVVIQHGHSRRVDAPDCDWVDFLTFDEMVERIRQARIVISHAGVGSIMVALANGKRPVVLPRRASFGEAVDDHQLELGRQLAAADLVTFVESPEDLAHAVEHLHASSAAQLTRTTTLAGDLRVYFERLVGRQDADYGEEAVA